VVDAGNTNVTAGVFEGRTLVASWRLRTIHGMTEDELSFVLDGLLQRDGIERRTVTASVLACVVPPLTEMLRRGLVRLFGGDPLVVRPGIKTGIRLRYDHPEEIGADRIVNALAAFERARRAAIVVDFGTSTNFDCVGEQGDFLGGCIAPGPRMSSEALFREAARLPRVEIVKPETAIGRSTVTALQSGLYHGYVGLVDGILDRLLEEMPSPCTLLATGGQAEIFVGGLRHHCEVVPDLTLEGLRILHERNR
jgi:type III pantothenate kinase